MIVRRRGARKGPWATPVFLAVVVLAAGLADAFEIAGAVRDEAGVMVAGATVWLRQDAQVMRLETNAEGRFAWEDAEAGSTEIVVWREGLAIDGFSGIVIGPLDVSFRLGTPGEVALRVIDYAYEPVEGARIKNMFVDDRFYVPVQELTAAGFPSQRSDAEGNVTITGLAEGSHVKFVVSHHLYADTFVAYLPVGDRRQNIVLHMGERFGGRVTAPDGRGVSGANVSVFQVGTTGRRVFADARTDPEGFYTARVPAGDYLVAVHHSDYASPEPKPVALRAGKDEKTVDVPLLVPFVIDGSVVGPEDRPMGGVFVSYWVGRVMYTETLTKHDGAFRILVPRGEGHIRIAAPDGFMTEALPEIPVRTEAEPRVQLTPLRLKPLPEIRGTARYRDRQAAPNVLVGSRGVRPPVWAITGDDGRFSIRLGRFPDQVDAQGESTPVRFVVEDSLRFLRGVFEVNMRKPAEADVVLESFEPDLVPPAPAGGNDLSPLMDEDAPELDCPVWFNTKPLRLENLRGRVVILTFWAGFDRRPEGTDRLEELRALHALLKAVPDVVTIGVHDGSADPEEVRSYVEERRIEFPVAVDGDRFGTFASYRVLYIPETVLIDRDGVVRYAVGSPGASTEGRLLELVKVLRRKG